MEGIVNFGPKVASFLLTSGSRIRYVVGAYVPPNNIPAVYGVGRALEAVPKGMEVILIGYLNTRTRKK